LLVSAAFALWNPSLLSGGTGIPLRSHVLLGVLSGLTLLDFALFGLDSFNGLPLFTLYRALLNLAWIVGLVVLSRRIKWTPSFPVNLGFHWLLFLGPLFFVLPWLLGPLG